MTSNPTTTAAAQTASKDLNGKIYEALDQLDRTRTLISFFDHATNHSEELHIDGDGFAGFKWFMLNAVDSLQKASEVLHSIVNPRE